MNNLIMEKVVYRFQDLVFQKKIKTFTKFLGEVNIYFKISDVDQISYKFICKELKNIYTFLKEIQHHPNSLLLAHALKPTFKFLLNNLIIPKIVLVADRRYFNISKIKYSDLILTVGKRRITQVEGSRFVIPYKGGIPPQVREKIELERGTNWVVDFVCRQIERKVSLSQLRYGANFMPLIWWGVEEESEFGCRLSDDYLNSESEYLPREITDFKTPWLTKK